MRSGLNTLLRGYVKIEVRGHQVETLMNQLLDNHIEIWDIRRTDKEALEIHLLVKDFFRLRPFLKQTGCRMHIIKRNGFPFLLDRLEKRKLFFIGFVGFMIGLYVLSSLIWRIDVEGNELISKEDVLLAAKKQGVYPLQWKFKLDDPDQISRGIVKELPGTSWVGVEIRGTQIHIRVVESKRSEPKPLLNPRHLISSSDAVITKIVVEKGRPLVKVNQRVKRGDILVSGILGDEEFREIVVAQGEIRGLVWHEYNIEAPLGQKYKVYTGESNERKYIVLGNRALQIWGYGKDTYQHFETNAKQSKLQWRQFTIPIGWMDEKVLEVRHEERKISVDEARDLALQQAKGDILLKSGLDAVIKEQKILHEKTESGKVYMKVLFEVEQNISKEQPIIQGE